MEKRELKYINIDFWSRPMFKDNRGNYFCCLDKLFPDGTTFEEVTKTVSESDIVYHGREYDDDPMGTTINPDKIKLVKEFSNENNTRSI
jgi:hypothetical protein